jgi:hypothetical protein
MEATRIAPLVAIVGFTCGLLLTATTPLAAQETCKPVDDALNKVITTATHIYSTMDLGSNAGGRPGSNETVRTETIYVGGSAYTKVGERWSRSQWTPEQVRKQEEENRQKSKYTCRYVRDESVNGETAAVYSTHAERSDPDTGQIKSDGQIWISKSKGLPLRQEFDIDSGDSAKHHHSARYEYTNVQPPL